MLTRLSFSSPEYFSSLLLLPSNLYNKSDYEGGVIPIPEPLVWLQDLYSSPASVYDTSLAFAAFFQIWGSRTPVHPGYCIERIDSHVVDWLPSFLWEQCPSQRAFSDLFCVTLFEKECSSCNGRKDTHCFPTASIGWI